MQDKKRLIIETKEFIPQYSKEGSAGLDLQAYLPDNDDSLRIKPGERRIISSGIKMEVPEGYMALITPRSGLAAKQGITITNSPGVIDYGYKDDVGIIIHNTSDKPFYVKHGDRIAQLLLLPVTYADVKVVDSISMEGDRAGGFGSSGI